MFFFTAGNRRNCKRVVRNKQKRNKGSYKKAIPSAYLCEKQMIHQKEIISRLSKTKIYFKKFPQLKTKIKYKYYFKTKFSQHKTKVDSLSDAKNVSKIWQKG